MSRIWYDDFDLPLPGQSAREKAWLVPYVGETHHLLMDEIRTMSSAVTADERYNNILLVLQSAGTGKSRCVHETAGLLFALPLDTHPQKIYPSLPPDLKIYSFFQYKYRTAYDASRAFFVALFSTAVKFLDKLDGQFETRADLALAWRNLLEKDCREIRKELYDQVYAEAERLMRAGDISYNSVRIEGNRLKEAILARVIQDCPDDEPVIMFYLDEPQGLSSFATEDGSSVYDNFVSVAEELVGFGLFVVILLRSPTLAKRTPSKWPPFTELPFDCLPDGGYIFRPNTMSLADVAAISFMVKFGRPMFWTRWKSDNSDILGGDYLVPYAQARLTGRRWGDGRDPFTNAGNELIACIGTRVLLEFDRSKDAGRQLEMNLVEHHMRVVYTILDNGDCILSGMPSEPMLAEAAALEMNDPELPGSARDTAGFLLRQNARNGILRLDGGRGVELVAQLLLTSAYDKAIKTSQQHIFFYSKGVTVEDFIKALFSAKYAEEVLSCKPCAGSGEVPLKDAFRNAYIRFTHFALHGEGNHIDTYVALAALVRGMAVQASHDEGVINIMIPITLEKERLREEIMTGILIQIHPRSMVQTPNAEKIRFFPSDCKNVRPYITILMHLDPQSATYKRQYALAKARAQAPTNSPDLVQPPSDHSHVSLVHPRYSIAVFGHSEKVYGVVHEKASFMGLLTERTVIAEHHRRDPANLAAVRRMKPTWERNEDCFHWIDVPALQVPKVIDTEKDVEDRVFITMY